ncbi:MAG: hypothetical protein K6E98_07715 [Lachnospiraceae bacterium]|nr:hypothetical protein [Lachnospiraceae bacterium]
MKHIKIAIKCAVFLSILIVSLYFINKILESKYIIKNSRWPTTSSYNQFYRMEKDSIDVLFLGSSVVVNSFIPQEIYNDYGIRSYNLGSEQQSLFISYYWLKEALRYQKPKVVVLDVLFMWDLHPESSVNMSEGLIRKSLDPMRWSSVKQEAVRSLCKLDNSNSEMSYYFTNLRYHSRWSDLKEYDFKPSMVVDNPLFGYAPIVGDGPDSYTAFFKPDDTKAIMEFQPFMQEYLDKIVQLCKENDIRLIMIDMPGNGMHDGVNNAHVLYSKENDVDYLNLCTQEYYDKIGGDLPKVNIIGHSNVLGAVRMSRFMGNLLHDFYGLQPVHDEQYENSRRYYEHMLKNSSLFNIDDPAEYFNTINDDDYAVFMAAKGDSSLTLNDKNVKDALRQLGLTLSYENDPSSSYMAVIIGGKVITEEVSSEQISYIGSIRDYNSIYSIISGNKKSGNLSSILIEGEEYSIDSVGLNVVVFDLVTQTVVDKAVFSGASIIR